LIEYLNESEESQKSVCRGKAGERLGEGWGKAGGGLEEREGYFKQKYYTSHE